MVQRLDGNGRFSRWAHLLAEPRALVDYFHGIEDFNYPGTSNLLGLTPWPPDIVHCHNLHGGYFDLRALSWLSRQMPTVMTLHDAWLLSGHCAHSFDCERWKIGCGECPDLTIYPAIRQDSTATNWQRKQAIYGQSRFYVATPSKWLMDKVEQSMLAPGVVEARVIPNGVDLTIFRPEDRIKTRASLALPQEAKILLFTANGIRANPWKDFQTLRDAIGRLAERTEAKGFLFLALGEAGLAERMGQVEIRFVPYQQSPEVVARYYQAADVYIHAAKAETFPNTILEALACGTPVVATAVGGIPEQIDDGVAGFLVPSRDARALASRVEYLLANDEFCQRMGARAAMVARERFDLRCQADKYLEWYKSILKRWQTQTLYRQVESSANI